MNNIVRQTRILEIDEELVELYSYLSAQDDDINEDDILYEDIYELIDKIHVLEMELDVLRKKEKN